MDMNVSLEPTVFQIAVAFSYERILWDESELVGGATLYVPSE